MWRFAKVGRMAAMRTIDLRHAGSLPDAVLRPVREGNALESTVEHLATAIRLGVFTAGEWLPPERELADRLHVGRATLREAIGTLRRAGLVSTHRGRGGGTVVLYTGADVSTQQRSEQARAQALDFRGVVEPGAAELAARAGLSGDQRAWLRETLQASIGIDDPGARRIATSRLHLSIASLSGSPPLVEAVTQARAVVVDLLCELPAGDKRAHADRSDAQHAVIVQAVLDGDHLRARAAMEDHCRATAALVRSGKTPSGKELLR